MTFGSIAEYVLRGGGFSWIAFVAGLICAVASFKLRWAAIAALGKFWSLHVEMRENHEFVQSGPFRWVRHPVYFSMILELLANGLLCSMVVDVARPARRLYSSSSCGSAWRNRRSWKNLAISTVSISVGCPC